MKKNVPVITVLLYGFICNVKAYDISSLQEQYPGGGINYDFTLGPDGRPIRVNLTREDSARPSDSGLTKSVIFTLYSRAYPSGYSVSDVNEIPPYFDSNKPTKFVTHGWHSYGKYSSCTTIKDGFLDKYDANVFIVDWGLIADNLYLKVVNTISFVGEYYSGFIQRLIDEKSVNPNDIHLVGHSLGAHVSGIAARNLNNVQVARITGLDPAGLWIGSLGLNKRDARFVDVIHTCGSHTVQYSQMGHVDFYPNGGVAPQPGCSWTLLPIIESYVYAYFEPCSHARSWQLFAASLKPNTHFWAYKCKDLSEVQTKHCFSDGTEMGDATSPSATGVYYLETTETEPYAKS